jgi:hypothetical protein
LFIIVVSPLYVTAIAPTPEHACPILRRVRRRVKKSFHVRRGCAGRAESPEADCEGAEDAFRTAMVLRKGVETGEVCGCRSLLGSVHVEKGAVAAERGAMMTGG